MRKNLILLLVAASGLGCFGFFETPDAFADCGEVTTPQEGIDILQNGGFLKGDHRVRINADDRLSVAMTVTNKKTGGESSGSFSLGANQYTQMKLQTVTSGADGNPDFFEAGGVDAYFFSSGDYQIVVRSLEGSGRYTTTIVEKLIDVSSPVITCVDESEWTTTYQDFTYSLINSMNGATWVDLEDYSLPCPLTSSFCGGPYILSPIITTDGVVQASPGRSLGSANLQLFGLATASLDLATAERTLDEQKRALRRARSSAQGFVATRTFANRRAEQGLRTAIRTADRATRSAARSREVRTAIVGLRRALNRAL